MRPFPGATTGPRARAGVQTRMVDERIGTEIAGFHIESVLGQGGMGTVYIAEQSSPTRKVVLKLLRSELTEDEAFRRRFVHESEAAASTEHPNIVPIYSAGEADGVLYIAMRYVEGDDLRALIAHEGRLPPERAIEIVSQVASALDAAHARGLVHRDVKPSNILLDQQGNAYLSDFGLIKRSEVDTGLTKTGQFMGSIEYCAPEQIRGDEVDGRADVYSLGCVVFEAISGRPPFTRDTEVATLYAHLEQEPPRLSSVAPASNAELDAVVAKALAKDPIRRFATAGAFARDGRHATGAPSDERTALVVPPSRRRIAWAAGMIGLAALVIAFAVTRLVGDGGEEPRTAAPRAVSPVAKPTVVNLDPETGAVEQSIGGFQFRADPYFGGSLAVGEGGVWVGNPPVVLHLDPRTNSIRDTISLGSPYTVLAVGFRTVWVASPEDVDRVNPATDQLLSTIPLAEVQGIPSVPDIAIGRDAVWVSTDETLFRVDPIAGRVIDRIRLDGSNAMALGEGMVWVLDDFSGTLTAFDESSGAARDSSTIAGSLDGVAVGGGSVWVLDREAGLVSVVDPDAMSVVDTIRVGDDERQIVFGAGDVWLADGTEGSVTRIDTTSKQLASYDLGGNVPYVAIGDEPDGVWAGVVPKG